jgi:hypothetical protein
MRASSIFLVASLVIASLAVAAPAAAAEPCVKGICAPERHCLEVYPWSRLCEGDVAGFLDAFCGTRWCLG